MTRLLFAVLIATFFSATSDPAWGQDVDTALVQFTNKTDSEVKFDLSGDGERVAGEYRRMLKAGETTTYAIVAQKNAKPKAFLDDATGNVISFPIADQGHYVLRVKDGSVVVFTAGPASQIPAETTVKFVSDRGLFSVMMPSKVKLDEGEVDGVKTVKNQRVVSSTDSRVLSYDVGYIEYGKEFADKLNMNDPTEFASLLRKNTAKNTQGVVLVQKDITLGKKKLPGYELLIEVSPKVFLRQRAMYSSGKLYQLMVAGTSRDAVSVAAADKFLESFQLSE